MLFNYLLVAYRNFLKHKIYSFMNVFGLAMGLCCSILVLLYVQDELSFDSMHPHSERTYRLGWGIDIEGTIRNNYVAPGAWATRVKEQMPEVEEVLRVLWASYPTSMHYYAEDKHILSDDVRWVEPSFPDVLSLDLVKGSKESVFQHPNAALISESAAHALFGDKDPVGEILTINDRQVTRGENVEMVITGVYRDYPQNSTFRHKYLFNIESVQQLLSQDNDILEVGYFQIYVVVKSKASYSKLYSVLESACQEMMEQLQFRSERKLFPVVRSLPELHFDSQVTWDFKGGSGSKTYLLIFSIVGFMILLAACVNYTNLTTARATSRAREVGIRKSFGSSRLKLAGQFLLESGLLSVSAVIVSVLLALVLLPHFNVLSVKSFTRADLFQPFMLMVLLIAGLLVTFLGGAYPALMLSGFSPIQVLKGKFTHGKAGDLFRKALVTFQFMVAIVLTIFTYAVVTQMDLIYHSKLNEQGDQLMALRWGNSIPFEKFEPLKNALLSNTDINEVTMGSTLPRLDHFGNILRTYRLLEEGEQEYGWNQLNVDFDFLKTFNLEFIEGRDFDHKNLGDVNSFIVNEALAKSLNKSNEEMLGQSIINLHDSTAGKIIGVVRDFPYKSAKHVIEPLVIIPSPQDPGSIVYVKLAREKIGEKIALVEKTWKEVLPDVGIETWFVNDMFDRMYKTEKTVSSLSRDFSILVIFITVFGLFGLASYMAERRMKEVGIRKVLGATAGQVVWLFTSEFMKIFFLAAIISVPVAYYLLDEWLSAFAIRIQLDPMIFLISLVALLLIIMITIGYETLKAAMTNPVDVIRHE